MRYKDPQKAQQIEDFVNAYYEKNYRPPSLREIEKGVGFSRQTVQRYLVDMNEAGRIQYKSGTIVTEFIESEVTHKANALILAGSISCGAPQMEEAWSSEDINGLINSHAGNNEYYALRAVGDSMAGAGIEAGDYVIIRKTTTADLGQIVVALSNHHENTLKRLVYDETLGRPVLHPENEKYEDIVPEEIEIQGVAVFVIKPLA